MRKWVERRIGAQQAIVLEVLGRVSAGAVRAVSRLHALFEPGAVAAALLVSASTADDRAFDQLLAAIDKDSDGSFSRDEVRAMLAHLPACPTEPGQASPYCRPEPVRDMEEGLWILVRWRRMHQHCAPSGHTQAEIATKTGIADKRGDFRPFPFGIAKKAM